MHKETPSQYTTFDQAAWLSVVVSVLLVFFLGSFYVTAMYYDGACMYTKWHPYRDSWFSYYGAWVGLCILLLIWSLARIMLHLKHMSREKFWSLSFYCFTIFLSAYYGYVLIEFWIFMDFERGLLSAQEYSEGLVFQTSRGVDCVGI